MSDTDVCVQCGEEVLRGTTCNSAEAGNCPRMKALLATQQQGDDTVFHFVAEETDKIPAS